MNNSERQARFLKMYRQQLKQDMNVMGHGQTPIYGSETSRPLHLALVPTWAFSAIVILTLAIVSAQA